MNDSARSTVDTVASLVPRQSEWPLLFGQPAEFARRYRWPLIILLIGATADAISTLRNLHLYGLEVEIHLVQWWVSHLLGVHAGVPFAKMAQLLFVALVAAWWRPWTTVILILCGILYAAAAISNHFLLL